MGNKMVLSAALLCYWVVSSVAGAEAAAVHLFSMVIFFGDVVFFLFRWQDGRGDEAAAGAANEPREGAPRAAGWQTGRPIL